MSAAAWHDLFLRLASIGRPITGFWKMRNGAVFWLDIPEAEKILDGTFAESVRFPFTFDEIVSIKFEKQWPRLMIENPLEEILAAAEKCDGLLIQSNDNAIEILGQ